MKPLFYCQVLNLFRGTVLTKIFPCSIHTSFNILVDDKKYQKPPKIAKRVKLYPGYQSSDQEVQDKLVKGDTCDEVIFAKKIIEDFYGLNQLEYDTEESELEKSNLKFDQQQVSLNALVKILKNERVQDICCIGLPIEVNYADYMLIGTCVSERHLNASFVSLNQQYKKLASQEDRYLANRVKLGKENSWCAIDLGRIVIHLFLPEIRAYYDLESLWTCGPEFDQSLIEFKKNQEDLEKRIAFIEVQDEKSKPNK